MATKQNVEKFIINKNGAKARNTCLMNSFQFHFVALRMRKHCKLFCDVICGLMTSDAIKLYKATKRVSEM